MKRLIRYAESQKIASIFLEVRASNREARLFYEKFGFQEIGIRKKYYQHPSRRCGTDVFESRKCR
ncbi:MAG: GNAT family N-acetyltransferase [Enterococcus avium]